MASLGTIHTSHDGAYIFYLQFNYGTIVSLGTIHTSHDGAHIFYFQFNYGTMASLGIIHTSHPVHTVHGLCCYHSDATQLLTRETTDSDTAVINNGHLFIMCVLGDN